MMLGEKKRIVIPIPKNFQKKRASGLFILTSQLLEVVEDG